jgi:hypothetical protein
MNDQTLNDTDLAQVDGGVKLQYVALNPQPIPPGREMAFGNFRTGFPIHLPHNPGDPGPQL